MKKILDKSTCTIEYIEMLLAILRIKVKNSEKLA